ncbi:9499_t:CDS:1, partial [Dentiscutata heterogama]
MQFELVRGIISKTQSANRLELPRLPEDIPVDIADILLFTLSIKDNYKTASVAQTLRLVYIFRNLLDSYFKNARTPLPSHPGQVYHSIRNLFPIRDRANLQFLLEYRRKLQKHYILNDKLPALYFDLLPEKLDLPSTR